MVLIGWWTAYPFKRETLPENISKILTVYYLYSKKPEKLWDSLIINIIPVAVTEINFCTLVLVNNNTVYVKNRFSCLVPI